jgi:hypothetical protein
MIKKDDMFKRMVNKLMTLIYNNEALWFIDLYKDIHKYLVYYNNDRVVDWSRMEHKMLW